MLELFKPGVPDFNDSEAMERVAYRQLLGLEARQRLQHVTKAMEAILDTLIKIADLEEDVAGKETGDGRRGEGSFGCF